jgi:hypothetical protein
MITLVLAFYVNDIMGWFKKGGPKENQKPAASSTSGREIKSASSSSESSPPRSEKGVSLVGKAFHNVPGKGTSLWQRNGPKEGRDLEKQGTQTFED